MLLLAARKVLLQSILTAMPMFMMENCWVPKTVINNLNKEFRYFLWGKGDGAHGMSLVVWERICRSHKDGGFST